MPDDCHSYLQVLPQSWLGVDAAPRLRAGITSGWHQAFPLPSSRVLCPVMTMRRRLPHRKVEQVSGEADHLAMALQKHIHRERRWLSKYPPHGARSPVVCWSSLTVLVLCKECARPDAALQEARRGAREGRTSGPQEQYQLARPGTPHRPPLPLPLKAEIPAVVSLHRAHEDLLFHHVRPFVPPASLRRHGPG